MSKIATGTHVGLYGSRHAWKVVADDGGEKVTVERRVVEPASPSHRGSVGKMVRRTVSRIRVRKPQ